MKNLEEGKNQDLSLSHEKAMDLETAGKCGATGPKKESMKKIDLRELGDKNKRKPFPRT